jgi:hypothetical protein
MAIQRVHPILGSVIVPRQGGDGGSPSKRVSDELDSIIGEVNNIETGQTKITGVPYTILMSNASVPNSGTGVTTLHSLSLPANSMANNGDFLEIVQNGLFSNTTNLKALTFSFGGIAIEGTGNIDVSGALGWQAYTIVTRNNATAVSSIISLWANFLQTDRTPTLQNGGFGGRFLSRGFSQGSVSNLNSNAQTILVQGQGGASNDVIQLFTTVRLTKMS